MPPLVLGDALRAHKAHKNIGDHIDYVISFMYYLLCSPKRNKSLFGHKTTNQKRNGHKKKHSICMAELQNDTAYPSTSLMDKSAKQIIAKLKTPPFVFLPAFTITAIPILFSNLATL